MSQNKSKDVQALSGGSSLADKGSGATQGLAPGAEPSGGKREAGSDRPETTQKPSPSEVANKNVREVLPSTEGVNFVEQSPQDSTPEVPVEYPDPGMHLAPLAPGYRPEHVLASVLRQLQVYQDGGMRCVENDEAIIRIETAIAHLRRRISLRRLQGVFGTDKPHKHMG